ncbi:hypothetical protein FOZ62_028310 [Perkinsus olseni]|uniref:Uncharacterized protein n=1 Tax=Perkinsus olseni TaxID=32597 RepID=A0A7J6NET4_PEROL|nr:hypothetical protein FOZ62_028310 [Perkinsus olseni]
MTEPFGRMESLFAAIVEVSIQEALGCDRKGQKGVCVPAHIDAPFILKNYPIVRDELVQLPGRQQTIRSLYDLSYLAQLLATGDCAYLLYEMIRRIARGSQWGYSSLAHSLILETKRSIFSLDNRGLHFCYTAPVKWSRLISALEEEKSPGHEAALRLFLVGLRE